MSRAQLAHLQHAQLRRRRATERRVGSCDMRRLLRKPGAYADRVRRRHIHRQRQQPWPPRRGPGPAGHRCSTAICTFSMEPMVQAMLRGNMKVAAGRLLSRTVSVFHTGPAVTRAALTHEVPTACCARSDSMRRRALAEGERVDGPPQDAQYFAQNDHVLGVGLPSGCQLLLFARRLQPLLRGCRRPLSIRPRCLKVLRARQQLDVA